MPARRRNVHRGERAVGAAVQPGLGGGRAQGVGREVQGPGGVSGVQEQQRPGPVAVVGDRAARGDGKFGGHARRRAVGLPAEAVDAVAQRVVAVAAGRQRAAGAHDEFGVDRVERARGRGGPQAAGIVRGRQGEAQQRAQVELPRAGLRDRERRPRPGPDGGPGGCVGARPLGGAGAGECGDEVHRTVVADVFHGSGPHMWGGGARVKSSGALGALVRQPRRRAVSASRGQPK
ncbi:hypothetical protein FHX78_11617 [Streptomyces capillispiralis]|uniref:Uncharacterized protein n=1 Tax=Streptomyces capillispiralis TaxID=68182 RepID=A0A561T9A1_9ACTN|nr:hypothetical protein FHX78_11617 [Streptomyces capillispiralis]